MNHVKKSAIFWILLIASVVVPSLANAQTTQKKKMSWTATITVNGTPVGSAILNRVRTLTFNPATNTWVQTSDLVDFRVRTTAYDCASTPCGDGEILVTKASLAGPGSGTPWVRVLCEGVTCTYQEDGNLDADGQLETPLPQGFYLNLPIDFGVSSTMQVLLNDGTLGSATFTRFM